MSNLENRIKTIESRVFVETEKLPEGVFCYVIDARTSASETKHVKGWRHNETRIMRNQGETDEELSRRAIAEMKPLMAKNAVPVFHSINEA